MIIVFSKVLQSIRCNIFSSIKIGCSCFNNCFVDSGKIPSPVLSVLIVMLQRATCKESAAKLFLKWQNLNWLILMIELSENFDLYFHFHFDCFRERPVKRSAAKQISKFNVNFLHFISYIWTTRFRVTYQTK